MGNCCAQENPKNQALVEAAPQETLAQGTEPTAEAPAEAPAEEVPAEPKTVLWVSMVGARGVRNADTWFPSDDNKSDCYAVLKIAGKKVATTEVESDTLEPVWLQEFEIKDDQWTKEDLEFEVLDEDYAKKADSLGKCTLPFEKFAEGGFNGEVKLEDAGENINALIKIKVRLPDKDYPSPEKPAKKIIVLERDSPKVSWGMALDEMDRKTLYVTEVKPKGAIKVHNDKEGTEKLEKGDFIVEVNGVSGNAKDLLAKIQEENTLKMEVRPPVAVYAYFGKGKEMKKHGLVFHEKSGANTLLITQVQPDSLAEDWNASKGNHGVAEGDRVLSVGGKSGKGSDIKNFFNKTPKQPFKLVVVRPAGDP